MRVINFVKSNKYFFLGLIILVIVVNINRFPTGYIFGGGDTIQLISAKDSFHNFFFDLEGRATFFYAIFYFLSFIGISDTAQLSFYLAFIIIGAYVSFWIFSKILFQKFNDFQISLVALFYSLNLYTLFLFTGNWGYSYFPFLYIFIPVLVGYFIKFLKSQNIIYGFWFCLFLFLGSSGFGNPAFALSFAIFLLLISLVIFFTGYVKLSNHLIKKIIIVFFFAVVVNLYWIMPLAPQIRSGVDALNTTNAIDFDSWIRSTSSPISYTLSLLHYSDKHFPLNFYYKDFNFLKSFFVIIAFVPIILISLGFIFIKKIEKNKRILFLILVTVFFVFIMLIARVRPPFETINYYIYHLWGFNILRGYDKTAIYAPFFMASLILIITSLNKKWLYVFIAIMLITPIPFYVGKLQQTAGYRVNSKDDYKNAKMSFLIKIPTEYYSIRKIINSDINKSYIATLPETYNDGSGIVYYPKWNFYGADITQYLYNKRFIEANRNYFLNWNLASNFTENNKSIEWMIKTLGMMNSEYIIYHKDAPESSVEKTLFKMRNLEKEGFIKNLEENDYFILYEINKDYFFPHVSFQSKMLNFINNPVWIDGNFDKIKSYTSLSSFQEINPKKFIVNFEKGKIGENLILAENYNSLWRAYAVNKNGEETEIKNHFLARGYANGWKLDVSEDTEKIIIEYYPIRLMWRGVIISAITILFLIVYILRYYYVKKKNLQD